MSEPLAYLLTWTCYGTWLHGNERGSVTRDDNAYGSPFVDAQPRWARMEAARLSDRPVMLDDGDCPKHS